MWGGGNLFAGLPDDLTGREGLKSEGRRAKACGEVWIKGFVRLKFAGVDTCVTSRWEAYDARG